MNKSYAINDNITLHYIPMEKLKTTAVGVYIHRKITNEEVSLNALLPYVLKSGCSLCRSTTEIAHYLENLYGADLGAGILKKGEDQIIYFDAETISDKYAANGEELLKGLLKLLISIIFEPLCDGNGFKKEFVELEKKNAIDRIEGVINDKRTYAQLRCIEEMCKGEPFGIYKLGKIEDIEKITPESLYTHYKKIITSSAIDIFVCGDADIKQIIDELKKINLHFEKAKIPENSLHQSNGEIKRITDKMEITQGKLCMGFKTNTPGTGKECAALTVANSIFGSGAHSKLFNNVREKLSLCYYASSGLDIFKGLLLVNAGIEFKNFQKAYDEILVQLEAVKNGDISDFEFESSISALENSYRSAYDDPRFMQNIQIGEIILGTNYSVDDHIKMIKSVTREDVIAAMKKVELDTVYFLTGKEDNR